jgi:hypothetical protein
MKSTRSRIVLLVLAPFAALALATGCSSAASPAALPGAPNAAPAAPVDAISKSDDPTHLDGTASTLLADVISAKDVAQTFGTPDDKIPYPDTYWPFVNEGVDAHWLTRTSSPLEKFIGLTAPTSLSDAKDWEHANHGRGVKDVQDWFGHCPGWTAAAMLNAPVQHAVRAKLGADGNLAQCASDDRSCTKFEVGDINALMAEIYVDAKTAFIGNRCDTAPADIARDQFGRIVRSGKGCQGLNPGSLLVVLADRMKKQNLPVAIDAQNDMNTDQIWNQPAYRYTVNAFETLAEAEAANLVATGSRDGDLTKYQWNDNAKGFARVDLTIHWVTEHGPNLQPFSGARSTKLTRVAAVIELDGAADAATTKIIGGEYLDDSDAMADRLTVPPFVWVATAAGPETLANTVNGNHHNPFVKPSLVLQLATFGRQ